MKFKRRAAGLLLWCAVMGAVSSATGADESKDTQESEEEVSLPTFPKDIDLIEFPVSAATTNRYFIDGSTLSPGKDGVVRYVMVIRTDGGATNVSFEGLRCATGEYRVFASGRADGSWGPAKISSCRTIEAKTVNRHHVALYREFFCPLALPIANAAEGRRALRLGKHPILP